MFPVGIGRLRDCIQSKGPGEGVDAEGTEEDRLSVQPATASQFTGKFEEAEMPSLGPAIASSDGMYHCPYQECEPRKTYRQKCLLRYKPVPIIHALQQLISSQKTYSPTCQAR